MPVSPVIMTVFPDIAAFPLHLALLKRVCVRRMYAPRSTTATSKRWNMVDVGWELRVWLLSWGSVFMHTPVGWVSSETCQRVAPRPVGPVVEWRKRQSTVTYAFHSEHLRNAFTPPAFLLIKIYCKSIYTNKYKSAIDRKIWIACKLTPDTKVSNFHLKSHHWSESSKKSEKCPHSWIQLQIYRLSWTGHSKCGGLGCFSDRQEVLNRIIPAHMHHSVPSIINNCLW